MVFAMDDRRVSVVVDADMLEPPMSRAQYVVTIVEDDGERSGASDA